MIRATHPRHANVRALALHFVAFLVGAWLSIIVASLVLGGCAIRWEDQNGPAGPEKFALEPAWPTGSPSPCAAPRPASTRDPLRAYEVAPPVVR
jgi:hypothetical protein